MRLILLGAPGSGKGTQGQRLAERYTIPEISTGDLLRQAVAAGTALGKAAKTVMDAGKLVSDDIVLGVIRERLKSTDTRKGFILDGFPRNLAQSEQLDELLDELGQPIDLAVLIEVEVDSILQRLLGRRTCLSCGASFNIFYAPPHMEDSCDECGGRLKRRSDDNEETIGNRLRTYETQSLPVAERYREQGRLRVIKGIGDIEDVFKAVSKAIDEVKSTFGSRDRSAAIRRAVARKQKAVSSTVKKPAVGTVAYKAGKKSTAKKASAGGTKTVHKTAKKTVKKKTVASKKVQPKKKSSTRKPAVTTKKTAKKKVVTKKAVAGKKVAKKKTVVKKKAIARKAPAKKKAAKKKVAKKKVGRKR